jgi:hypothetical protein
MKKRIASLFALLALCSCSMPYAIPVVEQPDQNGQPTPSRPFNGVLSLAQTGNVRVVWIHGMCTHDASNALQTHQSFAAALGAEPKGAGPILPPDRPQRIWFKDAVAGHEVETRYLLWSPLTSAAKQTLLYDSPTPPPGEFPFQRAILNNELKVTLMNDCFADAVIYTGSAGDNIRQWVYGEVCDAFGGVFTPQSHCDIDETRKPPKTVLVSESLGSKILWDALRAITPSTREPERREHFRRRLAATRLVFMEANQLPLLDIASQSFRLKGFSTSQQSNRSQFRTTMSRVAEMLPPGVRVVAFTDPNDLLSYRLPKDIDHHVQVTNVITSNDWTYLGVIERPDFAHCGYAWNPVVLGTIVYGYDGQNVSRSTADVPHTCNI